MTLEVTNSFDEGNLDSFSGFGQKFESFYGELAKVVEPDFLEYLQAYAQTSPLSRGRTISISLSIDANIIFKEVYGIMKGKPSYLSTFIANPVLSLYATDAIETEVMDTIDNDLPTGLDKSRAKEIAKDLLSKVTKIRMTKESAQYKYAYGLIGRKDKSGPTDAQYLGVAFLFKTHGVLSDDGIFNTQSEVKVWKVGKVGRLVSELTSGSLSLFILENGFRFACTVLYYVISTVLTFIMWLFEGLITFAASLIRSGVEFLSGLPEDVKKAIVIGGVLLGLLYLVSEGFRDFVSEGADQIKEAVLGIVKEIREALVAIVNALKQSMIGLSPFIDFAQDAIGYMFYSVNKLNTRLAELETVRYKGTPAA